MPFVNRRHHEYVGRSVGIQQVGLAHMAREVQAIRNAPLSGQPCATLTLQAVHVAVVADTQGVPARRQHPRQGERLDKRRDSLVRSDPADVQRHPLAHQPESLPQGVNRIARREDRLIDQGRQRRDFSALNTDGYQLVGHEAAVDDDTVRLAQDRSTSECQVGIAASARLLMHRRRDAVIVGQRRHAEPGQPGEPGEQRVIVAELERHEVGIPSRIPDRPARPGTADIDRERPKVRVKPANGLHEHTDANALRGKVRRLGGELIADGVAELRVVAGEDDSHGALPWADVFPWTLVAGVVYASGQMGATSRIWWTCPTHRGTLIQEVRPLAVRLPHETPHSSGVHTY